MARNILPTGKRSRGSFLLWCDSFAALRRCLVGAGWFEEIGLLSGITFARLLNGNQEAEASASASYSVPTDRDLGSMLDGVRRLQGARLQAPPGLLPNPRN